MDGESRAFTIRGADRHELPPLELKTARTSKLNGSGKGRKTRIRS